MRPVFAGYALATLALLVPPVAVKAMRIAPVAAGRADGSDWANAAPLTALNAMIASAGPGGQVWLRADQGDYTLPLQLTISHGGTTDAPVVIRGVDVNGVDSPAVLVGNRAPGWTAGQATGGEHIWVNSGSDHLTIRMVTFRDAGTSIRLRQSATGLTIEDIRFENVRRGIQNSSTGGMKANITFSTFRRLSGHGFSKQLVILRYDSHHVTIEDVFGDAEKQDGDFWSSGIVLDDTAHDILILRCEIINCWQNAGEGYWNADGFSGERGNYRIVLIECIARFCTDGGYDFKSQITLTRCLGDSNKRNFRMWGDALLVDCIGRTPVRYGSGSIGQVYAYGNSRVRVQGGSFVQADSATSAPFHIFETGFLAADQAAIAGIVANGTTANQYTGSHWFDTEGNDDARWAIWDHADTTAPGISSGTIYTVPENQPKTFPIALTEAGTLRLTGPDVAKFAVSGRSVLLRPQDYDVAVGPAADGSKVLKASLQALDENGNLCPAQAFQVTIADVDDASITPAQAFDYPGASGAWSDFAHPIFWADVAMTTPAQVGELVHAVSDESGFGRHLWQPDPERCAPLRSDGLYTYLDLNGLSHVYNWGQPGDFRFPNFTAFMVVARSKDGGAVTGYGLFFGRRSTNPATVGNATFWLGVTGGASVLYRTTGPNGTSGGTGGPLGKPIAMSFRTLDRVLRSNATQILPSDGGTGAAITNTYPLAAEQALVGARWDGTQYSGFFKGRLYGLAVLNQDCSDAVRFRIERQLGASSGAVL